MKFTRIFSLLIFSACLFNGCINENDEPPGCTTPDMPVLDVQRTEYTEGEDIVLSANPPADADNGAFEWQGPNRYFISQQELVIKNAKQVNVGEYKVYYLNEGRCRSKAATVFVTIYTFLENCGLDKNIVRQNGDDLIENVKGGTEATGNYSVTGNSDSIQLKIIFPATERPKTDGVYSITPNSGGELSDNELDILISKDGIINYYATPGGGKTVRVFYHGTDMHIAFCSFTFADNNGNNLIFSGNIVVP